MSHESKNRNTEEAAVPPSFNTADFDRTFSKHISEFEPEPAPLNGPLSDSNMVVLSSDPTSPVSHTQVCT